MASENSFSNNILSTLVDSFYVFDCRLSNVNPVYPATETVYYNLGNIGWASILWAVALKLIYPLFLAYCYNRFLLPWTHISSHKYPFLINDPSSFVYAIFTPGRRQSKTPILSRNVDQKSIETVFSIAICHHKWQSKTLFLSIFYPCPWIVDSVFHCHLPGVILI